MAGVNYNNTTKKPAVSNGEVDIDVSTPPIDGQVLVKILSFFVSAESIWI